MAKPEIIKIKSITASDLIDVFELSNQKSVRANSFNSGKIELENHKIWFRKKLDDPNTIMLKATVDSDFAGQVRLEIEGQKGVIGISVNENFRGRGLAGKLITAAIKQAETRGLSLVEACIKPENQASINLFQKNGFVYDSETEVSGCQALRYLYKVN